MKLLSEYAKVHYSRGKENVSAEEKVAFAIGALSGYLLGYMLTRPDVPSCNSSQVVNKLRDSAFWSAVAHERVRDRLESM